MNYAMVSEGNPIGFSIQKYRTAYPTFGRYFFWRKKSGWLIPPTLNNGRHAIRANLLASAIAA